MQRHPCLAWKREQRKQAKRHTAITETKTQLTCPGQHPAMAKWDNQRAKGGPGAGSRSQWQQDRHTRMEPPAGHSPKVTHAVPLGGPRDTLVSPEARHSSRVSCPPSCKCPKIQGFRSTSPAAPPPCRSLQRQRATCLCLSHLRHDFFPSRTQVKVLRLLYPKHKASPCAGEDAPSPSQSCEPVAPPASPSPEPRSRWAAAQDPSPVLPLTQGCVISSPPTPRAGEGERAQ